MKLIKKISLFGVMAIFGLSFFVSPIQAQVESCIDYYPKSSLEVFALPKTGTSGKTLKAGESIRYDLSIQNRTKVFIPDAGIILRIEKLINEKGEADEKIIEEIVLSEKIALKPGEKKNISQDIEIPRKIESGSYAVSIFPIRGGNMNIGSSDFYSQVFSAAANRQDQFSVSAEDGSLVLISDKMVINDESDIEDIDFNAESLLLSREMKNLFPVEKKLIVKSELFKVNYYSEDNIIDSATQEISFSAGETAKISFDVKKIKENLDIPYYLRTEIEYENGKIIDIVPINEHYFSHVSFLDKFPIAVGEKGQLISCIGRVMMGPSGKLKIETSIKDNNGEEVVNLESGDNPEENKFIGYEKTDFEIKKSYNSLMLETKIYDDGKLVDSYSVTYENPNQSSTIKLAQENKEGAFSWIKTILIGAFILMIVIILLAWLRKRRRAVEIVALFFFFAGAIIFFSNNASADCVDTCVDECLLHESEEELQDAGFHGGHKKMCRDKCEGECMDDHYDFSLTQTHSGSSILPIGCSSWAAYPSCAINSNKDYRGGSFLSYKSFEIVYPMRLKSTKEFDVIGSSVVFPGTSAVEDGDKINLGFQNSADAIVSNSSLITHFTGGAEIKTRPGGNVRVGTSNKYDEDSGSTNAKAPLSLGKTNNYDFFGGTAFRNEDGSTDLSSFGVGMAGIYIRPHFFGPTDSSDLGFNKCFYSNVDYLRVINREQCRIARCRSVGREIYPGLTGYTDRISNNCRYVESSAGSLSGDDTFRCARGVDRCEDNTDTSKCNNPSAALTQCVKDQCTENGGRWLKNASSWDKKCFSPREQNNIWKCLPIAEKCNNTKDTYYDTIQNLVNDDTLKNNQESIEITSINPGVLTCDSASGECTFTGAVGSATIQVCLPEKKFLTAAYIARGRNTFDDDGNQSFNDIADTGSYANYVAKGYADMGKVCTIVAKIEVESPVIGKCDINRSRDFDSSETAWPSGSEYCAEGTPSLTPNFPTVGNTSKWICSTDDGDSFPCSACKKIECPLKSDFCVGQKIPDGCGGDTCNEGTLTCDDDPKCCDGKWTEVKPN